jgi:hypothetical protein
MTPGAFAILNRCELLLKGHLNGVIFDGSQIVPLLFNGALTRIHPTGIRVALVIDYVVILVAATCLLFDLRPNGFLLRLVVSIGTSATR